MRDLAILTFQTLDGIMQSPRMPDEDNSGGFEQGGWASAYWQDVMVQVGREAMSSPYDMLFGRKTYDAFAAHWPNVIDDPAADIMNAAKKYVVSSGSPKLSWNNSQLITGDIVEAITRLKRQDGLLLQVHGSANLLQTLVAHDLIDEFRLWTFPVLVGPGKPLFAERVPPQRLKLVKSEASESGVVMTIYRRETA